MGIKVGKDSLGNKTITFHYDHLLAEKIRIIEGCRYPPEERYFGTGGDCPGFTDGAKRSRRIGTVPVI